MAIGEVLQSLGSTANGLTSAQARDARAEFGRNAIAEPEPTSPYALFFSQFKSILIWILIVASVVSGALGDVTDSIAILAIVLLNAIVGFYQEYSADRSIAALRRLTAPAAKVWRDGALTVLPSTDVVPGDVLELEAGDLVAADARLLSAASVSCIEAILTGEAEPVAKRLEALEAQALPIGDRSNMVFMGTTIAAGSARGVVVATAMRTELGRIASLVGSAAAGEETPLQRKLDRFGRVLIWATLGIVALLFALGLLRNEPVIALFMTSISLAVAALPESLPAVVTAALSLGVTRMSRRRALVRRLAAVETLGATNVICTDKTGTLTVGQMTARAMYVAGRTYDFTGEGYGTEGRALRDGVAVDAGRDKDLRQMAEILLGCNNAQLERDDRGWRIVGDPTEGALLCAALKAGADREALERAYPKVEEIPFDSERRLHSVLRGLGGGPLRLLVNGAPEAVLAKCSRILRADGAHSLTHADEEAVNQQNMRLADQGLRVLAAAFRDIENLPEGPAVADSIERDLVFVGLTGIYDPPRAEAKEAVAKCQAAGIRVVMITGDHPRTAIAIGDELGLVGGRTVTGVELDDLTDEALRRLVPGIGIYARVSAAHKLRIVRAWQANNAIVAMTGDGVNDAPAIKGADIGIAMGQTGAEVTKQASDMIITDDNFATIVGAVEQGRGIYDNIRKTLQYLLSCNASELTLMTLCILSGLPAPLMPIHLLWINLVTDGPPALCLAADRADPNLMQLRPRDSREELANEDFLWRMLVTAALVSGVSFTAYLHGLRSGNVELARSYAFAVMIFAQLLIALGSRSQTTPIWRLDPLANLNLLVVVGLSASVQFWSQHDARFALLLRETLVSYRDGLLLLGVSALPFALLEIGKVASSAFLQTSRPARRRWLGLTTATIIVAIAAAGWRFWPESNALARFTTRPIERGSVSQTIQASGAVGSPPISSTFAPLTGVVQFQDCGVGATVTKDQPCATITKAPREPVARRLRARLEAAQARLKLVQARLDRAATAPARAGRRSSRSDAKARVHNKAQGEAERLRGLIARLDASLRDEADLRRVLVRAPEAGIVIANGAKTGEQVEAGVTPLFTVTNPSVAQFEVSANEADTRKIEIGARAIVRIESLPPRSVDARVSKIDRSRNLVILVAREAHGALRPGTTVLARIEVARRDDVLRAPNEALSYSRGRVPAPTEPDSLSLWILRDGKPLPVSVRLGLRDEAHTEIVAGDVKVGDALIVGTTN
jgi:P-type Ca2+ transporter type 2C